MSELRLSCTCGTVRGVVRDVSPDAVNHIACYCDDCQTFPHALARGDVLDPKGGTEIVQLPPAWISITDGLDRMACLQLRPGGMVRWYASCCGSPVANTRMGGGPPFLGLHRSFVAGPDPTTVETAVGPVRSRVLTHYAKSKVEGADRVPVGVILRVLRLMSGWWWRGLGTSVLRDESGGPRVPPKVLSEDELAAARAKAGFNA
jgi:hypothetical protein